MADYDVDDVLKNIFDCEKSTWKPTEKIPLVLKEIESLKSDVKTFLSECNIDLDSTLQESTELSTESKSLIDELIKCREEIEEETMAEILKSIENHNELTKELALVNFAINIVHDIVQCDGYVREFDNGREANSYSRAAKAMFDLLQYIKSPVEGFETLDLFKNIQQMADLTLDSLLVEVYKDWDRMVVYSSNPGSRKTVVTITLSIDDSCIDILNALDKSKKLTKKVLEFSQFLLKEVLIPIMHNDCVVFAETDELMTVTINHKCGKPPYDSVIANMRLLFHYLSNKLNFEYSPKKSLMKIMGSELASQFRDLIVKECFVDTIPNNLIDLQTYGKITSEIEDFQRFLVIVKFFPDDSLSILNYVDNIDILFADKSSQYFLETARSIMLKDLSVTMSIGVESIPESLDASLTGDVNADEALKILDKTIPKSLFYFPRCMISKTAQELLDLVYGMMEQAVQCSDVVCKKLYNTTRLVFELYDSIVPYHHENYLQTIPQYVALFHNNCMYLAHNLQTLGDKWLILMEGREMDYPISFVDLVQKVRELGYKHLAIHMQQQRKQILDNIRSSDLNCIVVKDVLSDNAEAAIRQCLRQLQLLKNVWIGVFPSNVFVRLMATLVNMFFDELIHRVCTVEDISVEMGTQLTDMYKLVIQKSPALFQNPTDLETNVNSWIKLQELIFVLGGSLKDIEKRWNDGTGPLAVHFNTEELRSLIKALFQNTQFRANLLSKIK